ncbi:hypothetical protein BDN67DRAFT_963184 [Paxillus ammoniavirescens]|nr:hypothetical protein BDN67DRAFT_963184 [Paxillus ammoniavirescens]
MQKIQELWTPQSVTTTFKFPQFQLPPTKRLSKVSTIYTQFCGPGWVLALTMGPRPQMPSSSKKTYQLEFRAHVTRPSLGAALRATLSRSREGAAIAAAVQEQKITLQGPLQSEVVTVLWSGTNLDTINDANVTLKITITGSNGLFNIVSSFFTPPQSPVRPSPVSNSAQVLRVFDQSLGDGLSFDVKFLTNSKRLSSRHIYKPLPTYAHSAVLEEVCPKLDTLFPGGLACITKDDLPLPILGDYDDDYDSDIDDDDDEDVIEDAGSMVSTQANEVEKGAQPRDTASPAPPVTKADTRDIPDAEFDELCLIGSNRGETVLSPSPSADSIADSDFIESALSTRTHQHEAGVQLIHVKCAAHRTWRAFVYYCYTGKIAFYPLRSQTPRNKLPQVAGAPPSCSPKSMYRLADKFAMEDLKKHAFDAVKAGLSAVNVVDEALSCFTSRYPDIQKMELDVLVEKRCEPEVQQALETKITQLVTGQSPHSATALTALIRLLSLKGLR